MFCKIFEHDYCNSLNNLDFKELKRENMSPTPNEHTISTAPRTGEEEWTQVKDE
jgi:hypothetical protein